MSIIWAIFWFAVGAVVGAKHRTITLFLYEKYKALFKKKVSELDNK